jgi:deoxyribonuclease V
VLGWHEGSGWLTSTIRGLVERVRALVAAGDPEFATIVEEHRFLLADVAECESGAFYLRELPAICGVLAGIADLELMLVDGYVDLDPAGLPGLGAHLHEVIRIPVIGVAKTAYRTATHAITITRGRSVKPLYVTAVGIDIDAAAHLVAQMAGPYRLPDAIRRVDALARA